MDLYLAGKRKRLDPARAVGKGGEADVFDLGDGRALKVFKTAAHPDYQGLPAEQKAAEARIAVHQRKLPQFPTGLPSQVVEPLELATDRAGHIAGYAMKLIASATPLFRYADPAFRRSGAPGDSVVAVFRRLHQTLDALHRQRVVVGDFNDRNVLVSAEEPFLIDADSFQFAGFDCPVFTERFVDPLLCDADATSLQLVRPHGVDSDWYAFAVLLMQSLLGVDPYGGLYRPKDPAHRMPHHARPLRRITVFHPEVVYPKPATPLCALPDDLLHRFQQTFERDLREAPPRSLLDGLHFVTCASCGLEHARMACPRCAPNAALRPAQTLRVRGEVTCRIAFRTDGVILHASVGADGVLRHVRHEAGAYRREDGSVLFAGPLDPTLRFAIQGTATLIGRGCELVIVEPGRGPLRQMVDRSDSTAFASDGAGRFWISAGRLLRERALGFGGHAEAESIGNVLADQTRLWVGPRFGLGLYRAGELTVAFTFENARGALNDTLRVPPLRGELLDATCVSDDQRAWLLLALHHGGRTRNLCLVYARGGALEGVAEAAAGDGSWLGAIGGQCAVAGVLLAATDAGLVRVELRGGAPTVVREFPDTEPFLDAGRSLLVGTEGLYLVGKQEIAVLKLQ